MTHAKLIQFRRGRTRITPKHYLIEIEGCHTRKDAEKFKGHSVEWTSPAKKIIKGKIAAPHGNKGMVRAIFEIGLPGQAMGTEIKLGAKA
jgi:large subunit ribosomal protein L35Ae